MTPDATPRAPQTAYTLLQFDDETDQWKEHGDPVRASTSEAAVRKHAAVMGAGVYIAVPQRSWRPVTVKIETQTKVTLS